MLLVPEPSATKSQRRQRRLLCGSAEHAVVVLANLGEFPPRPLVLTDAFFGVKEEPDRPPQQACAIFSGTDRIGEFRYLLFEVVHKTMPEGFRPRHTFFGEIDVFTTQ